MTFLGGKKHLLSYYIYTYIYISNDSWSITIWYTITSHNQLLTSLHVCYIVIIICNCNEDILYIQWIDYNITVGCITWQ